MLPAFLPSPTRGVWHAGVVPVRAYALCILAGIVTAVQVTRRRWSRRGGRAEDVETAALPALVAGIVGARLYNIITDPELYFASGRHPLDALAVWDGGLGIPGALLVGAAGAWWGCRRAGTSPARFADAAVPGIAAAQSIGRWGNWFNNELHGAPTSLPWGLRIYQWVDGHAVTSASGRPVVVGYFQPTFLYESLWDAALAVTLVLVDRRWHPRPGQLAAGYVLGYAAGRFWVELLRDDYAHTLLGLRVNTWTSLVAGVVAATVLLARHRGEHAEDVPAAADVR